jgi:hypothetical protein
MSSAFDPHGHSYERKKKKNYTPKPKSTARTSQRNPIEITTENPNSTTPSTSFSTNSTLIVDVHNNFGDPDSKFFFFFFGSSN